MIFYYVNLAFTIWMLVDAIQRRADFYWYIILWIPFGPLAYFLAIKIHDYDIRPLKRLLFFERPPSVERLRYDHRQTPSIHNKLLLAEALLNQEQPEEAKALFAEILERAPDDRLARHGLGQCLFQLGHFREATEHLTILLQKETVLKDYEARALLTQSLWNAGEKGKAIQIASDLVRLSPSLGHSLLLAGYLSEAGRRAEAIGLLETALEDHRHAPGFSRRINSRHVKPIRRLLKELHKQSGRPS